MAYTAQEWSPRVGRRVIGMAVGWCALLGHAAWAQGSGRLYDPEPPLDSGYVRIVWAVGGAPTQVSVDGKVRVPKLAAYSVSDYLVLKEGGHTLVFQQGGKTWSHAWNVTRGKSVSLAYAAMKGDGPAHVLEDKGNTNKLKSLLAFYNLHPQVAKAGVVTVQGDSKVFDGVAYGSMAALQVNPIAIGLKIAGADKPATAQLDMQAGHTYSVFLFNVDGKPQTHVVQSTTERYTGP